MDCSIAEMIREGRVDLLKVSLQDEPKKIQEKDPQGVWLVQLAASCGHFEMVQYLAEYSVANFDVLDFDKNTILHYGVRSGQLPMVKYLVERVGLSALCGNLNGVTPFALASLCGFKDIVGYFEEKYGCRLKDMYQNPVCAGMHSDPSIVRSGDDYYMVHSSFVFFPCIPIMHSRDLIHWNTIGYGITNPEWAGLENLEGGRGYWAPDISLYNGRYYITATYRRNDRGGLKRLQMVTSSDRPEGPYGKPVFLDEDGIDPSLFTDVDGKRYMLLNRGARIFEISPDGGKILSEPRLLWYGDMKKAPEGPHLLMKDGMYYLFLAEGGTGTGHRISAARSEKLFGPYESCPYNPIMRQWNEAAPIQCCGHGKPFQTRKGDWYMVYLCERRFQDQYGFLGRETCLDPITWTADGWPVVNQLKGPSSLQSKPGIRLNPEPAGGPERENSPLFPEKGNWGGWMTCRGFRSEMFETRDGIFWIRGTSFDLNHLNCRSLLLKKQTSFSFRMECTVCKDGAEDNGSLGLTCYYDENSYLKFGIGRKNGEKGILVQEYVDDRYITDCFLPEAHADQMMLKIETEGLIRSCFYASEPGAWKEARILRNVTYLSSEGLRKGKRFTGAAAGIYVHGRMKGGFQDFCIENK